MDQPRYRPHILLPQPNVAARRTRRSGPGRVHLPTGARQLERIAPLLDTLERSFERRRAQVLAVVPDADPEEMLVLETVGSVDDFVKAVRGLPGLEWLGDVDVDEIPPSDDFFLETDRRRPLEGRLYLLMSNQRGLRELQRLWDLYREDQHHPRIERGRTKWRDLFKLLNNVRSWGPEDRILTTGFVEEIRDRAAIGGQTVGVEAELWYRADATKRTQAELAMRAMVAEVDGEVVSAAVIPEIGYHAVLMTVPIESAQDIAALRSPIIQAVHVHYVRPAGQSIGQPIDDPETVPVRRQDIPMPGGAPVVALLDGMPLQGHELLAGRLIIDDPDGVEVRYPAAERRHGTAMASLILHGDLGTNREPLGSRLYVRPILASAGASGESIPERELPVALVFRAVNRLFEGPSVAPTVRVINHSIGDPRRLFDGSVGAWGRALDYLSFERQVLVIASAGNYSDDISLRGVTQYDVRNNLDTVSGAIFNQLLTSRDGRRLISPAEGINVLTVGALTDDAAVDGPTGQLLDLSTRGSPSPYTRFGPGYRRAIKPDVVSDGGRGLLRVRRSAPEGIVLQMPPTDRGPGHLVASPATDGSLNAMSFTRGTSGAAAVVSRAAADLHRVLEGLRREPGGDGLQRQHEHVILKAMLVHSATSLSVDGFQRIANNRERTEAERRVVGHGKITPERVAWSLDDRVTLIGWGSLQAGSAARFDVPLPSSLGGVVGGRTVTVTLAWMTPVNYRHRAYRRAALWFDPYGESNELDGLMRSLSLRRLDGEFEVHRRGTVQHESFEGSDAIPIRPDQTAAIQVNCRSETEDLATRRIPYGLVITIESQIGIPIYDEILARVRPIVPIGVRA